jgi:hypothetical protein
MLEVYASQEGAFRFYGCGPLPIDPFKIRLLRLRRPAAHEVPIELGQGDDRHSEAVDGKPPAVLVQPADLGRDPDVAGQITDLGLRQDHGYSARSTFTAPSSRSDKPP